MNTRKLTQALAALTAVFALAVLVLGTAANAAIIVTTADGSGPSAVESPSGSDLANAGQATLDSSSASGLNATNLAEMNDGVTNDVGGQEFGASGSDFLTYTFDVSTNTLGYDITKIVSIFGHQDGFGGGRVNQEYEIELTFLDDTTATLVNKTEWHPGGLFGSGTDEWTSVVFENSGGGALHSDTVNIDSGGATSGTDVTASGVKAITFKNFAPATPGGDLNVHEFDVFGTATIPEPATLALLGLGGAVMLAGRRRRA